MKVECENLSAQLATPELIRELVRDGKRRGEFMILIHDDEAFVQVSCDTDQVEGSDDGRFVLEYREGKNGRLFHCTQSVSAQEVENIFLDELDGRVSWRNRYTWEPVKGYGSTSSTGGFRLPGVKKLAWMAFLALALVRPCSTLYFTLSYLCRKTPFESVFLTWNDLMVNLVPLSHSGTWAFQYIPVCPIWVAVVTVAFWYVRKLAQRPKLLSSLLLGIIILMNLWIVQVKVTFIVPGSEDDMAWRRERAEELARKCIVEDPATAAWAMALAHGKARGIDSETLSSRDFGHGKREEFCHHRLIGVEQEDGSVITNKYVFHYEITEDNVCLTNFTSRARQTVEDLIRIADENRVIKGSIDD